MEMFIELLGYILMVLALTTITVILSMIIIMFILRIAQKMYNRLF